MSGELVLAALVGGAVGTILPFVLAHCLLDENRGGSR